jgi:hypothetical protein
MKLLPKINLKPFEFFVISMLFFLVLFYVIDLSLGPSDFASSYSSYMFDNIFFAEIFALASTLLFVASKHKKQLSVWILSGAVTLLFISLSLVNYYAGYNNPVTESNYRTDVQYLCVYGEIYPEEYGETACAIKLLPHQDTDFLIHIGIGDYTNFETIDYLELISFTASQLFIFAGPIYFSLNKKVNTKHL